jgi:hypothetical protein
MTVFPALPVYATIQNPLPLGPSAYVPPSFAPPQTPPSAGAGGAQHRRGSPSHRGSPPRRGGKGTGLSQAEQRKRDCLAFCLQSLHAYIIGDDCAILPAPRCAQPSCDCGTKMGSEEYNPSQHSLSEGPGLLPRFLRERAKGPSSVEGQLPDAASQGRLDRTYRAQGPPAAEWACWCGRT